MEQKINKLKLTFMKQSLLKKLWLRTSLLVAVILCGATTAWGQDDVIEIGTVEKLKEFRDAVNAETSYAGKTVKLTADLDLSSETNWEPIGDVAAYPGKAFKGTFDGNGHTISHLTIDDQTIYWGRAALFGSVSNATIKNLNITDVEIKSHHYAGAIVAYKGDGTNVTIDNCHVKNGSIVSTPELLSSGSYENGDKVGAILGYGANPTTISGCSAENINISGYRDLGSIAGFINGTVTNCTAKDVTIVQDNKNGYKTEDLLKTCGAVVGGRSANAATVNSESSYSNVIINQIGLVAQIGNVKYQTLTAAVAAVPADGTETTITMIEDETIVGNAGVTIAKGQNVVIDLNGKTIYQTGPMKGASYLVKNNGTLTIKDSSDPNADGTGTGKMICTAEDPDTGDIPSYATNLISNYGTLNIESGYFQTLTNAGYASFVVDNYAGGTANISGGKLTNVAANAYVVRMFLNSTTADNVLNISGTPVIEGSYAVWMQYANANANKATLNISGGTLNATDGYALYAGGNSRNATKIDVAISGGTINGNGAWFGSDTPFNSFSVTGGEFANFGVSAVGGSKLVKGGTYKSIALFSQTRNDETPILADGFVAVKKGDVYVVIPKSELPVTPTIFHDEGTYEGSLDVAIAGEGTIMYKLNDGEATAYTAPITINETSTVTAWAEKDGVKSDEVSKEFTIVEKQAGAEVADGYYTIQTSDGKYVNVAGRKTVTLASDTKSAGTVIRVSADANGVKVLRSQAVDLPRYAERAMSYVPEIVKEVVNKLAGNVDDPIIGEQGTQLILDKFNEEFDYHLYLEGENNTYRIYGRTPSMKPVVDFYAENKELIDGRLLKVEGFVKEVLQKVVDKVGRGQSVVDMFKVKTIWQNMGGTLTEPTDEASTLKFYEEVLSSEKNVWDFAYQTGMLYWEKVKGYLTENAGSLGDYGKYLEKIPNVRPNFKYYIVLGENGVDIISEGNSQITDASTAWTLTKREGFDITFDANLSKNNGKEMYKTLYVDFGYKLPEGVTALKVTDIDENGVAKTEEIGQEVAPQTPVLLKSAIAGDVTLTIGDFGSAVTDNLLKGNDYLINEYEINSSTAEGVFTILGTLSQSLADKYEYLKRKNAGTVGNKYFFALSNKDLEKCVAPNEEDENDCVVRNLSIDDNGQLGFFNNWQSTANEAFLVSQTNPVKLTLVGDINRDGSITIADVTALVNIILGKATPEKDSDKYDFDAAYVNDDNVITIADVTALVNIILGK